MSEEVMVVENAGEVAKTPKISQVSIGLADNVKESLEGSGLIVADMGTKISRNPIERYKASTQKIDRIAFITNSIMGIKYHYVEGNGSLICLGGKKCKCCETMGAPAVRYLFPILKYSTDSDGNIVSKKTELRVLSASEDLYKSITTISRGAASMGGIDFVDLLVTCTDDQYQKITLNTVGEAAWRKSEATVNYVVEKWKNDGEFAYMAIARKVDEATMNSILGFDGGDSGAGAGTQSFDASANQDLSNFFND